MVIISSPCCSCLRVGVGESVVGAGFRLPGTSSTRASGYPLGRGHGLQITTRRSAAIITSICSSWLRVSVGVHASYSGRFYYLLYMMVVLTCLGTHLLAKTRHGVARQCLLLYLRYGGLSCLPWAVYESDSIRPAVVIRCTHGSAVLSCWLCLGALERWNVDKVN